MCFKISKSIHLVDVTTMQTIEVDSPAYWKTPFFSIQNRIHFRKFIIINIDEPNFDPNESKAAERKSYKLVEVEVTREEEFGVMDRTFIVNSYLGNILNYNDVVFGYDIAGANFNEDIRDGLAKCKKDSPDVILVKKCYDKSRAKRYSRYWKLKRLKKDENMDMDEERQEDMDVEQEDVDEIEQKQKKNNKRKSKTKKKKDMKKKHADRVADDEFETFLQDVEEIKDIRDKIDLYKDDDALNAIVENLDSLDLNDVAKPADTKDGRKIVSVKRVTKAGKAAQDKKKKLDELNQKLLHTVHGEEAVDENFPAVKIEELLDNMTLNEDQPDIPKSNLNKPLGKIEETKEEAE